MNRDQLFSFAERLRKEAIGEPERIKEKGVYEYQERSAKVVAVLKVVRAAQGVRTLDLLCDYGLFIDFGVIIRCVFDCEAEAYFLLETFPNKSTKVDKFVKSFFESTIDGHLSNETHPVATEKIRSAMVRVLMGTHDDEVRKMTDTIYRTFCGYVHANYAHIMEIYNGHTYDFNIKGVPSIEERQKRMEHVDLAVKGVLHAAAFIAHTLDLTDLYHDIVQSWQQQSEGYPLLRRKP
jgi:hypothetical protein